MSLLDPLLGGSLLSRERLMQAREFYSPTRTPMPSELAFAHWAQRVAVQTELGSARELAGLLDDELAALEAEFVRCPTRPRFDRVRHSVPVGTALAAMGGLALVLQGVSGLGQQTQSMLQMLGLSSLLMGLLALAVGVLAAFSKVHLDLSHGTTGLYVGRLDEQHPWLYKTMRLTLNAAAEDYRQRVLRERGSLRGMDHVLMQAVARAHEAIEETRSASSVAEQIQLRTPLHTARVESGKPAEPHLVRVASRSELRPPMSGHTAP